MTNLRIQYSLQKVQSNELHCARLPEMTMNILRLLSFSGVLRSSGQWFIILLLLPSAAIAEGIPTAQRLPSNISALLQEDIQFLHEETVISALRHEQPISEAPSNVYVITAEDIRQSGATDIPTLLRRVPGMEVMQMTGADINVSTRGGNQLQANRLLVMIDHRSIYNDAQGFVLWKALPVTLPEIKKIEVLIGPASVLYGFNAFDGIVHILTKSPSELKGTQVQIAGGEFHTGLASAVHAGQRGKLGYKISGGWDQNRKWRDRDSLAFRSSKANAQIDYELSNSATVRFTGGYRDVRKFDGTVAENALSTIQNSQGYAMGDLRIQDLIIRAYGMRTIHKPDAQAHPILNGLFQSTGNDGQRPDNRHTSLNLDAQHAFTFDEWGRLTYGLNIRHNRFSSNVISNFTTENRIGLFLQQEIRLPDNWQIVAGVRYDIDTFINPTLSPRISLIWAPVPGHSLLASYSIGYRPPTIFFTKSDFPTTSVLDPPMAPPIRFLGSQDLLPEQISSYELGYQGWFVNHRLRVRGNLFANLIRDVFASRSNTPARTILVTNRQEKAVILGTEFGVELLATSWLQAYGHYAFREFDKNFSSGGSITRAGPKHKWTIGMRGNWENGLSGELSYHYVAKATYPIDSSFNLAPLFGNPVPNPRVKSYALLNVRVGYSFWNDQAEIALSVFNALNDRHKQHPLGDTIGSRVLGLLTINL